ncbi:Ser/Thr protein kinase [Plasmodium coatneyi]|uniref:Ser/Thr protein kinase n=1 Tax=Plasmodium coatneyi TaxID=208452 RepID=A0A1B1DUU3_9APIC|nr:Ser/Thr protein kinase [Plasmodium coatneyi]ANQ06345.1 Ser/Thr protein kinase [Plasmodium coatneyi]
MDKYEAVKNLKIISASIDEHKTCAGRYMDHRSGTNEAIKKKNMKNKYLQLLKHTTNTRNCGDAINNRNCRHLDHLSSKEEFNPPPCNDCVKNSSMRLKHVETCDEGGKLGETRTSAEFIRYCNDPVEDANPSTGLSISKRKVCAQENGPPGGNTKGKEKTNLISFYKYNNLTNKNKRPGSVDATAGGLVGLPPDDEQYTVKCSLNSLTWKRLLKKGCGSSQENSSTSSASKICHVASNEDTESCKLYREDVPRKSSNYAVKNGARGGKGSVAKAGQPHLVDVARREPAESALINCFLKERLGNGVVSSRLGRGRSQGDDSNGDPTTPSRKGKASSEETPPNYCLGQAGTNVDPTQTDRNLGKLFKCSIKTYSNGSCNSGDSEVPFSDDLVKGSCIFYPRDAGTNDRKGEEGPNCRFCMRNRDTRAGSDSISYGEHAAVLRNKQRNNTRTVKKGSEELHTEGPLRGGASGGQEDTHTGSTPARKYPLQGKSASSCEQKEHILHVEGKMLRGNMNASKKAHSDSMLPSCKKLTTSEFRSRGKNTSAGNVAECIWRSEGMVKSRRRAKSRDPKGEGEPLGQSHNDTSCFYKWSHKNGRKQGTRKNKKLGTFTFYNKFKLMRITKKKSIFCYSEFVEPCTRSDRGESKEEVPSDLRRNLSHYRDDEVVLECPLDGIPSGRINRGRTLQLQAKAKTYLSFCCRKTNQESSSVPVLGNEYFNFSTLKKYKSLDKVLTCVRANSGYVVRCRGEKMITKVVGSNGEKGFVRQMEEETKKKKKKKKEKNGAASTCGRVCSRGAETGGHFPPRRSWSKRDKSRHTNGGCNDRSCSTLFSCHRCGGTQNRAPSLAAEKKLKKSRQSTFSERISGGKNQIRSSPVGGPHWGRSGRDTRVGGVEEPHFGRTKALCEDHLANSITTGKRGKFSFCSDRKRQWLNVRKERKRKTRGKANKRNVVNRKCIDHRSGSRHKARREKSQVGKEQQGPFFSLFEDKQDEGINQSRGKKKKKMGSKNGGETSLERLQKNCLSSYNLVEDKNCLEESAIKYVISVYRREGVQEDNCEKGNKPIRMKEKRSKDGRAKLQDEDMPHLKTTPCVLSSSVCINPNCTYYNKLYCIVGLIYCGEKSQVYKCMNVLNKKTYAMKVIMREERDDHHMNEFYQKYLFLKQNRHRNVIPIYDVFDEENYNFIVMEYCEGCTLLDYFMSLVPGSLEVREIKCIMKNLLLGLDFLHSNNIIHRDIKLENIMFKRKRKRDYEGEEFGSCALRGLQRSGMERGGQVNRALRVGALPGGATSGESLPSGFPSSGVYSNGLSSHGIFSSSGCFSSVCFSNGVFSNEALSKEVPACTSLEGPGRRTSTVLSAHSNFCGSSEGSSGGSSITVNSFHSHCCDREDYRSMKRGQHNLDRMSHEGNYMQALLLMKGYRSPKKGQKNISLLRFEKNEGTRCSTFRELTKNYITKKRRRKEGNNSYNDLCLIDMDMMEKVKSSKFSPNRRSEVICGTAPYMSPESLDGIISTANDVWSCGVILYALMDGRFPFQISNDMPVSLKKKILMHTKPNFDPFIWQDHPDVLDLCLKLLDPNPFTRIQNAREALIHYCFADMV